MIKTKKKKNYKRSSEDDGMGLSGNRMKVEYEKIKE